MMGAVTLNENLRENEILFSYQIMSSWIPFYDTYLPIFKNTVRPEEMNDWEYQLLEISQISNTKEYIAVEVSRPYRILATYKSNKYRPMIVKSKEKTLRSPEEISNVLKYFTQPNSKLVEV